MSCRAVVVVVVVIVIVVVVVVVFVVVMMMILLTSTSVLWAKYRFGTGEDLMPTQWPAMVCEQYIDGEMDSMAALLMMINALYIIYNRCDACQRCRGLTR